jgi:DNA repair protein RadC
MEAHEPKPLKIKSWSPEDRPREKLILKGTSALSNAELIAILLGSGTRTMSVVELARQVLQSADHDLHRLAQLSIKDLTKIKGIGEAKAITIIAAMEIGRRRKDLLTDDKLKITASSDAYEILRPHFQDIPHEEFWVLYLNRANRVIRKQQISLGGVAGTVADPKIILKSAIETLASGIILAHNHPSGNLSPSTLDHDLTKKMKEAGRLVEIQVLDHIIFGGSKYYSFADEGTL